VEKEGKRVTKPDKPESLYPGNRNVPKNAKPKIPTK
jgi:hypothetical protein